jgi:hypothetical protein
MTLADVTSTTATPASAFDLAGAKARLNITGTTQDVALQLALDATLAIVETYLDRKLAYATETAKFYYQQGREVLINRYPLDLTVPVTATAAQGGSIASNGFKVHHSSGAIVFGNWAASDELSITYAGGFKVYPPDLLVALWGVFDSVWPTVNGSSGGASTVAAGTIESVSIVDVGTIKFATGAAAASASASAAGAGLIPAAYLSILDRYRNHAPIGVS